MGDIHLSILAFTALAIVYAEIQGSRWMRGRVQTLNARTIHYLHVAVWAGLFGMIATGLFMVLPAYQFYLSEPAFLIKLCFVGVLVLNAVLIGRLQKVAIERPYASLSKEERRPLLISGALSTTGWIGAAIIGFFFL